MPLLTPAHDGRRSGADRAGAHPPAARRCRRAAPAARAARDSGTRGTAGSRTTEWEASLEALVAVGRARRAAQGQRRPVRRLTTSPRFELTPRPGTPEADAVPGARRRVVLRGRLTLDGATVRRPLPGRGRAAQDGLVTPCQLTLPSVRDGRYSITVMADAEASGCGVPGARDRALDVRRRARSSSAARAWRWPADARAARRRLVLERDAERDRPAPDGVRAARCSRPTAASSRAGRASRPTSAPRAAAWRRCAAPEASPASASTSSAPTRSPAARAARRSRSASTAGPRWTPPSTSRGRSGSLDLTVPSPAATEAGEPGSWAYDRWTTPTGEPACPRPPKPRPPSPSTRPSRSGVPTSPGWRRSCSSTACGCCRAAGTAGRRCSRRPASRR